MQHLITCLLWQRYMWFVCKIQNISYSFWKCSAHRMILIVLYCYIRVANEWVVVWKCRLLASFPALRLDPFFSKGRFFIFLSYWRLKWKISKNEKWILRKLLNSDFWICSHPWLWKFMFWSSKPLVRDQPAFRV